MCCMKDEARKYACEGLEFHVLRGAQRRPGAVHNLSKMQLTIAVLSHIPHQLWFRISFSMSGAYEKTMKRRIISSTCSNSQKLALSS